VLTAAAHIRCTGIPQVRVMCPDRNPGGMPLPSGKMDVQVVQRLAHMAVAQVPGIDATAEHLPVVSFSTLNQTGVLFRLEQLILRRHARTLDIGKRLVADILKLLDDLVLAGTLSPQRYPVAIVPFITGVFQAAIALPGLLSSLGINLLEILHDCCHRLIEAVHVQPIKANLSVRWQSLIMFAQPVNKLLKDCVPPHPHGKALEVRQSLIRTLIMSLPTHIAIDPIG